MRLVEPRSPKSERDRVRAGSKDTPKGGTTVAVAEVAIRAAEMSDAEAIAGVHSSAWRTAFTFLPSRYLEAMTASTVLARWEAALGLPTTSMFVALGKGDVIGFLRLRADGDDGEVMALYVDPLRWRQGVGSALLEFGERWLVSQGVSTAVLWTAKESPQSRSFYEESGWVATGNEQTQLLGPGDLALHEVEYRKSLV
jgi:GNAT superfamily N-acetyltransferase